MANTQRHFSIMGQNLFKIANKITQNQRLCRLLKYQVRDPFSSKYEDVDGVELLNKQILIVPKLYDDDIIKTSFLVVVFDDYSVSPINPQFKSSTIRFDIACPYDEWQINDSSLRPYLIMEEIDKMFNQVKLQGIGNLQFHRADTLTLTPQLGGYSLRYKVYEFN